MSRYWAFLLVLTALLGLLYGSRPGRRDLGCSTRGPLPRECYDVRRDVGGRR